MALEIAHNGDGRVTSGIPRTRSVCVLQEEPDLAEDVSKPGPSPMLRRQFKVGGRIARARAYVTSHGLYELRLNGQRVGDQLFTPGWTSYGKRLQYQTYDVTSLLRPGENAVGAVLGNGWYRGERTPRLSRTAIAS